MEQRDSHQVTINYLVDTTAKGTGWGESVGKADLVLLDSNASLLRLLSALRLTLLLCVWSRAGSRPGREFQQIGGSRWKRPVNQMFFKKASVCKKKKKG